MAHFRGTVQGSKGSASRLGGKNSGLTTTNDGWNAGITVRSFHNEETGRDEFRVYATQGSNENAFGSGRHIATIFEEETGLSRVTLH